MPIVMSPGPNLAVLLERRHDSTEMIRALTDILAVTPASVIEFHDLPAREKTENAVFFELSDLAPGDFVVELTVCGSHGLSADSELASALARRLGERVLGSVMAFEGPLSQNPFAWVLATPDGKLHLAYSDPDVEPGLVLDGRLDPWPPRVGQPGT